MVIPHIYDVLMMVRPSRRPLLVGRQSALLIEGYPRSANTFATAAFALSNPGLHIGHHLHAPTHVDRAVRLAKPVLILIREPAEAVLSYVIRAPALTLRDALDEYVAFYGGVWPLRDDIVVGLFEEVTSDFGALIARMNARFGTSFAELAATPKNTERVLSLVEAAGRRESRGRLVENTVARPSKERELRKEQLRDELCAPGIRQTLQTAREWYQRYVALRAAQAKRFEG